MIGEGGEKCGQVGTPGKEWLGGKMRRGLGAKVESKVGDRSD